MLVINPTTTALAGLLAVLGLASCSGADAVEPFEQITDPTQLYMRLVLAQTTITLSTTASFNTLQLTATPLDATGAPIPGLLVLTFRSPDTVRVKVISAGLVTGVQS